MNKNVKHVRSNEIDDIFSYEDANKKLQYIKFPRTFEMTTELVFEWLN